MISTIVRLAWRTRLLRRSFHLRLFGRFDRDALAFGHVKWVILLEGINDIGHSEPDRKPYDPVTAEEPISAFEQTARRAHSYDLRVIGATIL